MSKILFLVIVNFIISLFQDSFLAELLGANLAPNIVFAYAYSFNLLGLKDTGLISALIGGLLLDLLGVSVMGSSSFVLIALLFISYLANKYLLKGLAFHTLSIFASFCVFLYVANGFSIAFSFSLLVGAFATTVAAYIFRYLNKKAIFRIIDSSYIQLKFKDL